MNGIIMVVKMMIGRRLVSRSWYFLFFDVVCLLVVSVGLSCGWNL